MDMTFGMWNVRSLYRTGSLMRVARKTSKYKLGLVGVQDVSWDRGVLNQQVNIYFCMKREIRIMN
jgi:hypothetical protein